MATSSKLTVSKYEITIVTRQTDKDDKLTFHVGETEKIEGNDLLQLVCQFVMAITRIQRKEAEQKLRDTIATLKPVRDDDIPF